VPYQHKDEVKALGAKWDRQEQSWYVPPGVDVSKFAKWPQGSAKTAAGEAQHAQGNPSIGLWLRHQEQKYEKGRRRSINGKKACINAGGNALSPIERSTCHLRQIAKQHLRCDQKGRFSQTSQTGRQLISVDQ
jgi:hypothetical protein